MKQSVQAQNGVCQLLQTSSLTFLCYFWCCSWSKRALLSVHQSVAINLAASCLCFHVVYGRVARQLWRCNHFARRAPLLDTLIFYAGWAVSHHVHRRNYCNRRCTVSVSNFSLGRLEVFARHPVLQLASCNNLQRA